MNRTMELCLSLVAVVSFWHAGGCREATKPKPPVKGKATRPAASKPVAKFPAELLSEDTVAICSIDLSRLDGPALEATAKAVLADKAGLLDKPIEQFHAFREKFTKAGGQRLVIFVPVPKAAELASGGAVLLAEKADEKAMRKLLAKRAAKPVEFRRSGAWLVFHEMAEGLPKLASGQRLAELRLAIAQVQGRPFWAVLVPNEELREKMSGPPITDAPEYFYKAWETFGALLQARWLSVSAKPGRAPLLHLACRMPDEAAAEKFMAKYEKLREVLKEASKQDTVEGGWGPMPATGAKALYAFVEAIRPRRRGLAIEATVDLKAMKSMGEKLVPLFEMMSSRFAATGPAAKADPAKAKAIYERGLAIEKRGDINTGIAHYYRAIQADPAYAPALNHFAWLRAANPDPKLRDPAEAVRLAERACKAAVDDAKPTIFAANCLDTLAVAYAAAGRFKDTVATQKRAIAMARAVGNRGAVRSFTTRLKLFETGKPYHDRP